MIPRRNLLALSLVFILCAAGLAAWYFAGPVKGDPAETMRQWAEYEHLGKLHPASANEEAKHWPGYVER